VQAHAVTLEGRPRIRFVCLPDVAQNSARHAVRTVFAGRRAVSASRAGDKCGVYILWELGELLTAMIAMFALAVAACGHVAP